MDIIVYARSAGMERPEQKINNFTLFLKFIKNKKEMI